MSTPVPAPMAHFDGLLATDLVQVADLTADPGVLDRGGWWAVLATFEGELTGYRFAAVTATDLPTPSAPVARARPGELAQFDGRGRLPGRRAPDPPVHRGRRRLSGESVPAVVRATRFRFGSGRPGAPVGGREPCAVPGGLAAGRSMGRHGLPGAVPVQGRQPPLVVPDQGHDKTGAALRGQGLPGEHHDHRPGPQRPRPDRPAGISDGDRIVGATGAPRPGPSGLHRDCPAGDGVGWAEILAATFPPGSVTGAPKIRAQQVISELEPVPRGPYCGGIGYIDADAGRARLAVGIRTFFTSPDRSGGAGQLLNFGTGAGITYPSDPADEWAETELKAANLIALASAG